MRRRFLTLIAAGLVLAGCGGSTPTVTDLGSESASTGSSGSSGSGSASGTASGSSAAAADAECSPVNADLEAAATSTVEVSLVDYAFDPSSIEVEAGIVTFITSNDGTEAHEFAVLPGGGEVPVTAQGAPDEDALEQAGAFELEAFGPGQDCNGTWDLAPGSYTLFCIVESADGRTHAEQGMVGDLTVT